MHQYDNEHSYDRIHEWPGATTVIILPGEKLLVNSQPICRDLECMALLASAFSMTAWFADRGVRGEPAKRGLSLRRVLLEGPIP